MTSLAGLQLHHVGYVTKNIDPVASMYVSRFGYRHTTPVIHDPVQTALVQFLQLPGDQAYLEFVAPDGPESKLIDAVKRRGALNHLCYTAGHLEAAVQHLEEDGMRLISELSPGVAFGGRRICWLLGEDMVPIELVERMSEDDLCTPGTNQIV
jgi:methylmalonyl-CoA/ethylmalonyl-CoA epimerase